MTPEQAMEQAMERAGLTRAHLGRIARAEMDALDALVTWRRGHGRDEDGAWSRYRVLLAATDALIEARTMQATIATSVALVREGRDVLDERPCGHSVFEACEGCTVDPDAPSLVALAERHDLSLCLGASNCICSCTTCMREHEGALG